MLCISAGRFSFILLSLFYIHFVFGNTAQNVDPNMIASMIGNLTQVMGQSESMCGSSYTDMKPSNEDFCSDLDEKINFECPSIPPAASPPPPPCSEITGDIMESVHTAVENTLRNGNAVCHCCMVPSICLLGGVGRIVDLLRVGNYAGLLMGLNNNKICAAVEKTQRASAALDTLSGTKCIRKGGRCRKVHGFCIEKLNTLRGDIERTLHNQCSGAYNAPIDCSEEIAELEEHISSLESSSSQKCGSAYQAGQSQIVQAALTGVASLVATQCKKDYERDTKCDDKKDEDLDICCEKHPRADACKQDPCEGQQGAQLDSCCLANRQSALCAGRDPNSSRNVCHASQITNDPRPCLEKCKENPAQPGCKDFCNLYWDKEVCKKVCETYDMPRCDEDETNRNICDSSGDHVCCEKPNSPACGQFCTENPESPYCRCANNPGQCRCDREQDIPYMPAGQCDSEDRLPSEDCEDPEDPGCRITDPDNEFPGRDSDGQTTGDPAVPWAGPPPFAGKNKPNTPSKPSGSSKYSSAGGGGAGGGLGGGLGGGGGSGGGGSGSEGEEGVAEEGEDPYEDILAGLSGDQNRSQGFGGGGGRGSRAGAGSGFDLRKFLPKKKKTKKTAGKKSSGRVPAGAEDNIFDISSQMMGRYCVNNNINCIHQK